MKNNILIPVMITLAAAASAEAQTGPATLPPVPLPAATATAPPLPPPTVPVASVPQPPPPVAPMPLPPPMPLDPNGGFPLPYQAYPTPGDRPAWVALDFFLWRVKNGPSPNPLVTFGSASDAMPGALGQPHTTVVFGGGDLDYGTNTGGRITAGFWLPQCPFLGIEGSYFGLEGRRINFSAVSDDNGNPVIARPVINAQTGAEMSYIDSLPGVASGGAFITSSTELQSFEFNLAASIVHRPTFDLDFLLGFRALSLDEDLNIQDNLTPLTAGAFTLQGGAVDPPNSLADFDGFRTTNHFYGGQLGARMNWDLGRFDVGMTAKVALGVTQQTINVDGLSTVFTPGAASISVPGGILAQTSNIGRYSQGEFSVVPEGNLNLGYQITPWLRATVGYTFLYWSNVVRPGDQIDRTVNPSLVPTDQGFGTLTGPGRPVLVPQQNSFWAQGVNLGLEFRF